jgi:hypothetical protein
MFVERWSGWVIEHQPTYYLSYAEAVTLHVLLMRRRGETRFGVFEPALIKSALARPRHAAIYENADLFRQAATLCFGLIKNHPWAGGNKRTATFLNQDTQHWNTGKNCNTGNQAFRVPPSGGSAPQARQWGAARPGRLKSVL